MKLSVNVLHNDPPHYVLQIHSFFFNYIYFIRLLETRWQEYFTLDEKTGRLKLKSSIEHIDRDDIRLTISVSDKGEDPNSVSVQV